MGMVSHSSYVCQPVLLLRLELWEFISLIVVPTLSFPRLPFPEGFYLPSWVEWGETAGSFGLFALFYLLFTKFFPIISIWEIREGRESSLKEVEERIASYLPGEFEEKT